jgi:Flp pilus assembly protein TadG
LIRGWNEPGDQVERKILMKHQQLKERGWQRALGRHRSLETGVASVEFALLGTMLAMMLLGATDFARVLYAGITVTNAARAGTQYGTQSTAKTTDFAGMQQAALTDAQDLTGVSAVAVRFCECPDGTSVNCSGGSCGVQGASRIYVRVTVTKTFTMITSFPGLPHQMALQQISTVRAQ